MLSGAMSGIRAVGSEISLKRRIAKHMGAYRESTIGLKALIELKTVIPAILSYLWMAVDANLNILITGNGSSGETQLLFSLTSLIPRHEQVAVFGGSTKELSYHDNFISFVPKNNTSNRELAGAIRSAPLASADRLIVKRVSGIEAKELFSLANHGLPFLSTMVSGPGELDAVNLLRSKQMSVPQNTINMLDILIFMSQGNDSIWKVQSITEYSWLSRAEYFLDEAKTLKHFEVKISNIVDNGILNEQALVHSKAINAYSDFNVVNRKEAIAEFGKRKQFVNELGVSARDASEYIRSYFKP